MKNCQHRIIVRINDETEVCQDCLLLICEGDFDYRTKDSTDSEIIKDCYRRLEKINEHPDVKHAIIPWRFTDQRDILRLCSIKFENGEYLVDRSPNDRGAHMSILGMEIILEKYTPPKQNMYMVTFKQDNGNVFVKEIYALDIKGAHKKAEKETENHRRCHVVSVEEW